MNLFFKLSCCKPSLSTGIYFSKRYNKFAPFLQQIFSLFQMNEDERSSWMSCSVSLSLPTKQVTGLDRLIRLVLCDSAIFLWEATNSFNHIKKYFQPYQQICSLFLRQQRTNFLKYLQQIFCLWLKNTDFSFPFQVCSAPTTCIDKIRKEYQEITKYP